MPANCVCWMHNQAGSSPPAPPIPPTLVFQIHSINEQLLMFGDWNAQTGYSRQQTYNGSCPQDASNLSISTFLHSWNSGKNLLLYHKESKSLVIISVSWWEQNHSIKNVYSTQQGKTKWKQRFSCYEYNLPPGGELFQGWQEDTKLQRFPVQLNSKQRDAAIDIYT